jgi:hypothetical protein
MAADPKLRPTPPKAAKRVIEFFTTQINNDHSRKAYMNSTRRFAQWGEARGIAGDHVRQPDGYAGQIVRWRDDQTKQVLINGSVTNTGDLIQRDFDEVNHPTVYHTPFIVDFEDIRTDTNQPKWRLQGISVSTRGQGNEQGCDSTCALAVIKRGKELHHPGGTASR